MTAEPRRTVKTQLEPEEARAAAVEAARMGLSRSEFIRLATNELVKARRQENAA